jgi:hypothetical protein
MWTCYNCFWSSSFFFFEKWSCRTCGTPQKYASALSASVPRFDLGRFVRPELVRVRGQGFQTFGEKGEEEDGLFSF